ncbi:MAG: c-type cytochrome [Deltaproteobacteria bacterium]|nr:c-type cytochrome [Deltaproteobacteria bacterium]
MKRTIIITICLGFLLVNLGACSKKGEAPAGAGSAEANKGIGPISSVTLEPLDAQKAAQGEAAFKTKCSACHKIGERYVGPDLKGVTLRRQPEWIMNMILNPTEMLQKDPVAQELLATYLVQMTFQNVTPEEARSILEFFRKNDAQ